MTLEEIRWRERWGQSQNAGLTSWNFNRGRSQFLFTRALTNVKRDPITTCSTLTRDPNATHAAVQPWWLALRTERNFSHWHSHLLTSWLNLSLQGVYRQRQSLLGEIAFLQMFLLPIVLIYVTFNILMSLFYLSVLSVWCVSLTHRNTENSVPNTDQNVINVHIVPYLL